MHVVESVECNHLFPNLFVWIYCIVDLRTIPWIKVKFFIVVFFFPSSWISSFSSSTFNVSIIWECWLGFPLLSELLHRTFIVPIHIELTVPQLTTTKCWSLRAQNSQYLFQNEFGFSSFLLMWTHSGVCWWVFENFKRETESSNERKHQKKETNLSIFLSHALFHSESNFYKVPQDMCVRMYCINMRCSFGAAEWGARNKSSRVKYGRASGIIDWWIFRSVFHFIWLVECRCYGAFNRYFEQPAWIFILNEFIYHSFLSYFFFVFSLALSLILFSFKHLSFSCWN